MFGEVTSSLARLLQPTIAAWYGVKLCLLNRTLATPGLEINLAVLYASAVVGGVMLVIYAVSMIVAPPPIDRDPVL